MRQQRRCVPAGHRGLRRRRVFGECIGDVGPTREACNDIDDDCDGETDEDFGVGDACDGPYSDLCTDDVMTCSGCSSGPSEPSTHPTGRDDDCDGLVDADCETEKPARHARRQSCRLHRLRIALNFPSNGRAGVRFRGLVRWCTGQRRFLAPSRSWVSSRTATCSSRAPVSSVSTRVPTAASGKPITASRVTSRRGCNVSATNWSTS